jgi:ABC-type dipeptide/oligopeptide/nickel transport system permease subunit
MRTNRFTYYLAWGLLILLILAAVLGGWLKPHGIGPSDKINLIAKEVDGKLNYVTPPFAPRGRFLLGTDHRGLDMLSLLLNGFKYTLGTALLITLSRFVLALLLGMWSGATGKGAGFIRSMQWVFSSVPAFIFLFPPLYGMYFGLRLNTGAAANPHYMMLFTMLSEFVQVLFLLGQLAVFNIVLGGSETLDWDLGLDYLIHITTTGEWCSLIAYGAQYVRLYPWIILSVGSFYTAAILVLQFFLSQLKKKYSGPGATV